jgi:transcriptional regulator with XRE-family HTH domain
MTGETIGQRMKRLRLERGLSQRELSVPGVSYAYISRIEGGTRQPSVKALRMIAPKLGVTVEYLEFGWNKSAELRAAARKIARQALVIESLEKRLGRCQRANIALREALQKGDR